MERGAKTMLAALGCGDRFHKAADKTKKVFTVVCNDGAPSGYINKPYNVRCLPDLTNPKYPDNIKSTTEVIFLRHTDGL